MVRRIKLLCPLFEELRDGNEKSVMKIEEIKRFEIELVHARFRRAKGRPDSPDLQLERDLAVAQKEKDPDPAILKRLSDNRGDPGERFEEMASLLKKLNDYVLTENPEADTSEDPVIVSTGQVVGCRAQDMSENTADTIAHCPYAKLRACRSREPGSSASDCDRTVIIALLEKLANGNSEQQRAAAGELRLLAKRNADNRVCIAEAGAVPLLVELLSSTDPRTQEHAVTALLNLSINDSNKGTIVNAGAIPHIVDVLKNGSMEARENAAVTLFSLSVIDENKVAIGAAGAIPARAVRAGIVPPLMRLLKDTGGGMVDEALAILAILASHQEGKVAIGQAESIRVLLEVIRIGSPRNRENAAAILWSFCTGNLEQLKIAKEFGAELNFKRLLHYGYTRKDISKIDRIPERVANFELVFPWGGFALLQLITVSRNLRVLKRKGHQQLLII
ncbi:U-box domain-containing protein 14 [Hibiscus syriacus]|uniref:U-box domain-containing protein 14 n=1 Tax=Hibiscus syriacus TaxID=106335 RepID=A0A6A2YVA0_HIBSY|nr:U-box domain-containing protein 14 [Hibiscus syriacus]